MGWMIPSCLPEPDTKKRKNMSPAHSGSLPLRTLLLLLVVSTAGIAGLVWQAWEGLTQMEWANVRQEHVLEVKGDVLYETEKMMTYARLYTRTTQTMWLERYNTSKALQEERLQQIYQMAPGTFRDLGEEIETNKDLLNELENASFLLMRQNYRQEGLDLLSGPEYLGYGDAITKSLTHLTQRLTDANEAIEEKAWTGILWRCITVVVVLVGLLGVWMFCLRLLILWRRKAFEEIQQRYNAESRLTEQGHILDKIIENMPLGVFVKSVPNNYRWDMWNRKAEELFGLTAEKVLGTSDFDHFPEHEATYFRQTDEKVMREGKVVDIEEEEVTTSRGTWLAHTIKVPIFNDEGKPILLMGIIEDITMKKQQADAKLQAYAAELEQKNDELEESRSMAEAADRAKSEFLATMSHEIRTPLNGVLGTADLLSRTVLSGQQDDYVRTIRKSGETLLYVINDILDLTKLEANQLGLETIAFDFSLTIEDVIDIHSANASKKELELLLRYAPGTPERIYGDPGRLRQILNNLISNAIKFTDTGHILVSVEELPGHHSHAHTSLKISVQDTGIGIDTKNIQKIFQRFTQAEASTTRKYGGTGLGLAICKQLVELMGGEIGIDSEEGQGSTFWFTLPTDIDTTPVRPLQVAELAGRRVMVVDDNPVNISILEEQLAYWGCTAKSFASGEEVLEWLSSPDASALDIGIIDHDMPEMSGGDLGENLRFHPVTAEMPMMVFSSRGMRGDAAFFQEKGFNGYLVKPSRPEEIRIMLAALLAQPVREKILTRHYINEQNSVGDGDDVEPFRMLILVAEDDMVNQKVVRQMLEELGCEVSVAASGPVAIDMFKLGKFDLVFMDMQMPDMDGPEAAENMRRWEQEQGLEKTPIVALTANAMAEHRALCMAAGMDDYMTKPLNRGKLVAQLNAWNKNGAKLTDKGGAPMSEEQRRELHATFVASAKECMSELEDAALFNDDERWKRAAHRLKGAAGAMGYMPLQGLCSRAEKEVGAYKDVLFAEIAAELVAVNG
jgi:PAS domain S-box-containing protein